jgi:hypothetical protein
MTQTEVLAIVGIAVAVLAIIASTLAIRTWGNRRKRLAFEVRSAPLIATGGPSADLLKVTFRDIEVPDPHLATIRLSNIGPADISSDSFDAGRSFVVKLNCKMYGVTATTHPQSTVSTAIGSDAVIQLAPQLIAKGEEWVVEAVVSGSPSSEIESPLVDTDIVSPPYASAIAQSFGEALLAVLLRRVI